VIFNFTLYLIKSFKILDIKKVGQFYPMPTGLGLRFFNMIFYEARAEIITSTVGENNGVGAAGEERKKRLQLFYYFNHTGSDARILEGIINKATKEETKK
jgi:hypothetical protein